MRGKLRRKLVISNGLQGVSNEKITILPVDHDSDLKIRPVVFILGYNVAKYKNMPYDLGNSKWPPGCCFRLIVTEGGERGT